MHEHQCAGKHQSMAQNNLLMKLLTELVIREFLEHLSISGIEAERILQEDPKTARTSDLRFAHPLSENLWQVKERIGNMINDKYCVKQ